MSEMLFNRLATRLRGMVGRAVIRLVNDATALQTVQAEIYAGQVRDGVEHFQTYGLSSVPLPGAEGIALALGGSSGNVVMICVDDRRFRVTALAAGEVALHDDLGHRVHLTRDGIVIDGAGQVVTITNTPKLRVEADLEATGQIKDLCDGAGTSMSGMRTAYNGHAHSDPQGGSVGGPSVGM